jgi:hypothetical protein
LSCRIQVTELCDKPSSIVRWLKIILLCGRKSEEKKRKDITQNKTTLIINRIPIIVYLMNVHLMCIAEFENSRFKIEKEIAPDPVSESGAKRNYFINIIFLVDTNEPLIIL